jgi:hypothetical protein
MAVIGRGGQAARSGRDGEPVLRRGRADDDLGRFVRLDCFVRLTPPEALSRWLASRTALSQAGSQPPDQRWQRVQIRQVLLSQIHTREKYLYPLKNSYP